MPCSKELFIIGYITWIQFCDVDKNKENSMVSNFCNKMNHLLAFIRDINE
jgi:hypothetical protein